jgi:hypothetical protein
LTSGFTSTAIQELELEHPTWYAFARKQGKEEMRHCGSAWVRAREIDVLQRRDRERETQIKREKKEEGCERRGK